MATASDTTAEHFSRPARRYGPDGKFYCAPWCGCDCTWAAFNAATRKAVKLAETMGDGWQPRVHENGTWHWSAISPCGRIYVSPHERAGKVSSFTAFIGEPHSYAGRWTGCDDTDPQEAVRDAVATADADLAKVQATIGGLDRWR